MRLMNEACTRNNIQAKNLVYASYAHIGYLCVEPYQRNLRNTKAYWIFIQTPLLLFGPAINDVCD
jgi:hypothetical protein